MKPLDATTVADVILRDALERHNRCRRLHRRLEALAEREPAVAKYLHATHWALRDAETEVVHALYLRDPTAPGLGLDAPEVPPRGVRFGRDIFVMADDETLAVVRASRVEGLIAKGGHDESA